jgi:hypothetical protein
VTTRQKIVTAARWGIAHEPRIHYGEIRPIPLRRRLPLTTDCSGFVTLCYFLGGAPDPNGNRYSGYGWTGTLLQNLAAIPLLAVRNGDIVVWGTYPGRHCAIVLEADDDDPLLCSHGAERGPIAIRFSDECRYQPPIVTWLTVARRSFEAVAGAAGDDVRDDRDPDPGGDDRADDRQDAPAMRAGAADGDEQDAPARPFEAVGGSRAPAGLRHGSPDLDEELDQSDQHERQHQPKGRPEDSAVAHEHRDARDEQRDRPGNA